MNNHTTTGEVTENRKRHGSGLIPNVTALQLIDERQVAELYGFKLNTLRNWRALRRGPRYLKINGKMIRYRINDIEDYLAACVEKTVDQRD